MNMHILTKTKILNKKLIILFSIPLLFLSCNKEENKEYNKEKRSEIIKYYKKESLKEYNKNMEIHEEFVSKINAYFKDSSEIDFYEYMTDDCVIKSYVAGKPLETPVHEWIDNLEQWRKYGGVLEIYNDESKKDAKMYTDKWNRSFFIPPLYLPGCDMDYSLDGSVRLYYVASADEVVWSGYDSVNFREGKISLIESFADFGGVQNLSKEMQETKDKQKRGKRKKYQ